jgi:superfamily II DNA or RNA helicase
MEAVMARVGVVTEEVRQLVAERLVPLFLAFGSTAAVVKALNGALQAAHGGVTIHPNRVHALLSADPSRGVNARTLAGIREAAEALWGADEIESRAKDGQRALREKARRLHLFGGANAAAIAGRLGVPAAVALVLLQDQQTLVDTEWSAPLPAPLPRAPDWSYQNVAVSRCLHALANGPAPSVGLVLPTGAGKTRTALRIVLAKLREAPTSDAPALWVTHRKNLREQAYRELQKLIASGECAPGDLALAARIKFIMVQALEGQLKAQAPVLIVIDEAHHAAADSYQPAFAQLPPAPLLLLTATPNRTDGLPIGIDEVAFTITYRELADRGAVLIPAFVDFPVDNFDWSPESLERLAAYVVEQCKSTFQKVLVLAPRIDRVREFYDAIVRALPAGHTLEQDDLGYVHGSGNSLGIDNEDFLERFARKPRAVLVSAQLLLEGFDDPAIDTVLLTYPSSSMVRLMQAAGRCVRYAPGKTQAFVVQARNDAIAYHFDHRWLYQEISDYLRPEVIDIEYTTESERVDAISGLLKQHRVADKVAGSMLERVAALKAGESSRLFLFGLPYFGDTNAFATEGRWGAVLETDADGNRVRTIFNEFCAGGADTSDPSTFLERAGAELGVRKDSETGSVWRGLVGLLTAAYCAKCEVHGPGIAVADRRPFARSQATSWLKYVNFLHRPVVPAALATFLADCHNREAIGTAYAASPGEVSALVKVPLPLGGAEAFLLTAQSESDLDELLAQLRDQLSATVPEHQVATLVGFLAGVSLPLSARLLQRLEFLLQPESATERFLRLSPAS